jgi:hypothetical protein
MAMAATHQLRATRAPLARTGRLEMTDQNQSSPTPERNESTSQEREPTAHPCNDPDIAPIQFLEAVMHDDAFSIAVRMKAAKHLASIAGGIPQSSCTLHIPDPYSQEYIARYPRLLGMDRITRNDSLFSCRAQKAPTLTTTTPGPINLMKNIEDLSFEQIKQIIANTDLDSLPLCECGHRMFFPCRPVREH